MREASPFSSQTIASLAPNFELDQSQSVPRWGKNAGERTATMKRSLIKANVERWERGFAALAKFYAREGHCRTSRRHKEGNYSLGPWVSTQRYCREQLSAERKRHLDAMGFVWDCRNYRWEQNFTALLRFKRREGHCLVPATHREGNLELGYWVSTQRRRRSELSAEWKARLNKIGFVWNPGKGRCPHKVTAPNPPPPRA